MTVELLDCAQFPYFYFMILVDQCRWVAGSGWAMFVWFMLIVVRYVMAQQPSRQGYIVNSVTKPFLLQAHFLLSLHKLTITINWIGWWPSNIRRKPFRTSHLCKKLRIASMAFILPWFKKMIWCLLFWQKTLIWRLVKSLLIFYEIWQKQIRGGFQTHHSMQWSRF